MTLLVIIGVFWLVVLSPWVFRKWRDARADRSIAIFEKTHHTVPSISEPTSRAMTPTREVMPTRPHLTLVQDVDTRDSIENRLQGWGDWTEADNVFTSSAAAAEPVPLTTHRFAAYSHTPSQTSAQLMAPSSSRSMSMVRRRAVFFSTLGGLSVLTSIGDFFMTSSWLQDVTIVAWVALATYVATALYAVSQGYLNESSLGIRRRPRRSVAITTLPRRHAVDNGTDEAASGRSAVG